MNEEKTGYGVLVYVCVCACLWMCTLKYSDVVLTRKMISDQRCKGGERDVDTWGVGMGGENIFKNGVGSTKSPRLECACIVGEEKKADVRTWSLVHNKVRRWV